MRAMRVNTNKIRGFHFLMCHESGIFLNTILYINDNQYFISPLCHNTMWVKLIIKNKMYLSVVFFMFYI